MQITEVVNNNFEKPNRERNYLRITGRHPDNFGKKMPNDFKTRRKMVRYKQTKMQSDMRVHLSNAEPIRATDPKGDTEKQKQKSTTPCRSAATTWRKTGHDRKRENC